jgi:hypothetical protein
MQFFEVNLNIGTVFWQCVSNFVKIGKIVPELQHSFEIQYGGRPPSRIFHNADYEVTSEEQSSSDCVREIS